MRCPDIHDLTEYVITGQSDPKLDFHIRSCPRCEADLKILQGAQEAFLYEEEVPERLVRRVMEALPPEVPVPRKPSEIGVHVLGSGVLGWLTAAAALLASGVGGSLNTALTYTLAIGIFAGAVQLRMTLRRIRDSDDEPCPGQTGA